MGLANDSCFLNESKKIQQMILTNCTICYIKYKCKMMV